MRSLLVPALLLSSLLSACSPSPVELPEDDLAAASTCFTAQRLVAGQGKSEGDPMSFEEFSAMAGYPMAAAGQADDFDRDVFSQVTDASDALVEDLRRRDYSGAIPACEARFGIDEVVDLPENDAEALLSCTAFASFMQGAMQGADGAMADRERQIVALAGRLSTLMEADPDLLVMMIASDVDVLLDNGLQHAFAEGAPAEYLAACEARFPA